MWTPQPPKLLRVTLLRVTLLCVTLFAAGCLRKGDELPRDKEMIHIDFGFLLVPDQEPAELDLAPSLEVDAERPCTPGSRVGLCALCDEDSNHIMPSSDEACAPIDCSSLNHYLIVNEEDGGLTCLEAFGALTSGSCYRLGECHSSPDEACKTQERSVITVYPGCGELSGCDGVGPVQVVLRSQGERCHGFGECSESGGPCTVPQGCEGFEYAAGGDQQTFCEADESTCTVHVNSSFIENLSEVSCLTYCVSANQRCLGAWTAHNGLMCERGSPVSCENTGSNMLCVCG